MLRDDAIRQGKIEPTKEDRERMGMDPIKPGPKAKPKSKSEPKSEEKPKVPVPPLPAGAGMI